MTAQTRDSSAYTVSLTVYTVVFTLGRDRDHSEDAERGSRKERPKMELSANNIAETFKRRAAGVRVSEEWRAGRLIVQRTSA